MFFRTRVGREFHAAPRDAVLREAVDPREPTTEITIGLFLTGGANENFALADSSCAHCK
jgi:hypothetical protein